MNDLLWAIGQTIEVMRPLGPLILAGFLYGAGRIIYETLHEPAPTMLFTGKPKQETEEPPTLNTLWVIGEDGELVQEQAFDER